MKILVTGAAGFIGSHLVKRLSSGRDVVVGIDNMNDYYDVKLKYTRLQECGIPKDGVDDDVSVDSDIYPQYTFQKLDITHLGKLDKLFKEHNFDYVLHMAAQPGVRYSLENPHAYVQSNLVGFVNILECCRNYHVKHLVYASSSSVYGMNNKVPFNEEDQVDHPVSLYAATKKSNELMAHTYSHLYQLPTTGLRFFTVYGPWGRPDMAPMLFANAIYAGRPIKVFNGGDMKRDFTYIDDIVESVVRIIYKIPEAKEKRPYYRIFNIGNSQPIQLMDFIKTMEVLIGVKAHLELHNMQPGDVKETYADTDKLQKFIAYRPKTMLKDGVSKFVNWYKDYVKNNILT